MKRAQEVSNRPYESDMYKGERIADFTPAQQQVQRNVLAMQGPAQFGTGSALAYQAGLGALNQNYNAGQFTSGYNPTQFQSGFSPGQFSVGALGNLGNVRDATAERIQADKMNAAQTQFQANLERFQMAAPDRFNQAQAEQYMSPYIRNVLDTQKREAIRDARQGQIVQDLGAARQGTYGGSRQLLASLEREKNLGQQMGDIRARGMQSAFENAQAQFERDRAAGMTTGQQNLEAALRQQQLGTQTGLQAELANLSNEQQARVNNQAMQFQAQGMNQDQAMRAALANQGVDTTRAQANQQAALGVQQLGAQQGMQAALANLDAASQTNVQNLAAQLQTQGLNAEQAMRAALANQQAGLTVGQQNLQAALQTQQLGADTGLRAALANQQQALEAQRLGEQSRQFGASQGLAGLQAAGQMGQTLGNLGQYQQQANLQRLQAQAATAGEQRALEQQGLDMAYADFLRQRDFQQEMLGQYSNLLRGLPMQLNTTQTTYAPPPSMASQVLGTGLGALGMARTLGG
jgi:hypothetical protein